MVLWAGRDGSGLPVKLEGVDNPDKMLSLCSIMILNFLLNIVHIVRHAAWIIRISNPTYLVLYEPDLPCLYLLSFINVILICVSLRGWNWLGDIFFCIRHGKNEKKCEIPRNWIQKSWVINIVSKFLVKYDISFFEWNTICRGLLNIGTNCLSHACIFTAKLCQCSVCDQSVCQTR